MLFFFYAQAQDIKFTWNGTDLKDGDKIEIKAEAIDYGGGFVLVTAETNNDKNNLRLVNTSNDYVDATVTATIVSTSCTTAPMLQLCCGGDCSATSSNPIKKKVGFDVDTSMKAMMDASFQAVDNYGDFVTTLSAESNGKVVSIIVDFSYSGNSDDNPQMTELISGIDGNITWCLNTESGVLTLCGNGTGNMRSYNYMAAIPLLLLRGASIVLPL